MGSLQISLDSPQHAAQLLAPTRARRADGRRRGTPHSGAWRLGLCFAGSIPRSTAERSTNAGAPSIPRERRAPARAASSAGSERPRTSNAALEPFEPSPSPAAPRRADRPEPQGPTARSRSPWRLAPRERTPNGLCGRGRARLCHADREGRTAATGARHRGRRSRSSRCGRCAAGRCAPRPSRSSPCAR